MNPRHPVYVVGGVCSPFLGHPHPDFISHRHPDYPSRRNPTLEEHLHGIIRAVLHQTGVDAAQIDRGYVGNFLGECFSRQGHLGAMAVGAEPGLAGRPFVRVEAACASGGLAVTGAIDALHASSDVVLAVGVEVETNTRGRDGVEFMARAAHYETQRQLSAFTFPHLFGRRAWAYREAFGNQHDGTARVVEKAHRNARSNPLALMQTATTTLDDVRHASARNAEFLEDPRYRSCLRMLDCTLFADGAAAVILANERGLERLGVRPEQCSQIVGIGHTVQSLGGPVDPTRMTNVATAASLAYRHAGVVAADVGLAEVHDCFSIAELQCMEALGLCEPGQAGRLVADGVTQRDGRLPINPGGGLLGFGHPVGATGVKQVVEVWRQLTGRNRDYPIAHPASVAVTANIGGDDRTAVVMVHRPGA